jgi:hemerythrin-like domain-containing protein
VTDGSIRTLGSTRQYEGQMHRDTPEEGAVMDPRDTVPERAFASHEHRELGRGIDRLHEVGAMRGTKEELSVAILEVIHWIDTVLEPHAHWEDRWLYPEIDERAGTAWATRLMVYEHQQIRDAAHALASARTALHDDSAPAGAAMMELRGRAFALEAIIRAHMEREERFLIPMLDDETAPLTAHA